MYNALRIVGVILAVALVAFLAWAGFHWLTGPADGPKTAAAKKLLANATDGRQAVNIREQAGPQEIQCDRTTPNLRFFDSVDGSSARIWYSQDVANGHVYCWDSEGFDPFTGQRLRPVGDNGSGSNGIRRQILTQEPLPKFLPPPPLPQRQPQPPSFAAGPPRTGSDDCPGGCNGWGPIRTQSDGWGPPTSQSDR